MNGTIGKTNFLFNNSSSIDKTFASEKKGSLAMKGFDNSIMNKGFLSMTGGAAKTNSIFG